MEEVVVVWVGRGEDVRDALCGSAVAVGVREGAAVGVAGGEDGVCECVVGVVARSVDARGGLASVLSWSDIDGGASEDGGFDESGGGVADEGAVGLREPVEERAEDGRREVVACGAASVALGLCADGEDAFAAGVVVGCEPEDGFGGQGQECECVGDGEWVGVVVFGSSDGVHEDGEADVLEVCGERWRVVGGGECGVGGG